MLRYSLCQLELSSGTFILLPKLSPVQVDLLRTRLENLGFRVGVGSRLTAKRPGQTIHVSPAGFCWSRRDPTDAIVPVIPRLLASARPVVSMPVLRDRYFRAERGASGVTVRFTPRIEGGSLWTELRASGNCGLTPDEGLIARTILGASSGKCRLLTDFPVEGSRVRLIGKRQYYDSVIDAEEAASTLRVIGERRERNCYLTKDGVVHLDTPKLPARAEWVKMFVGLGEWCHARIR